VELGVLVTAGLGDNSYLVASGDHAAVVDPQRDAVRTLGLTGPDAPRVRYVFETHVHNDYVSGALEVARATGAEVVAPARGGYAFPHRSAAEGDPFELGDLRLVALETPGHTPEHTSYLVEDRGDPVAVFTGGSLMVGGAGRTDLLGSTLTDELTRAQFRTLRRLAALPDEVSVLPTHGAGSFCGAGPTGASRTSTMGEERAANAAMGAPDEQAFVRRQLSGLPAFPDYYGSMAPINRAGPRPLDDVPPPGPLSPDRVAERIGAAVWAVDARLRDPFARAHIPGSLNVELAADFASYVGWVVPFDEPLILVLPEPAGGALEEAVSGLLRIGYDRVEGYLDGGIEAWRASGRPLASYRGAGLEELCREYHAGRVERILDVRQRTEWDAGHISGSVHVFVGDLPDRMQDVPRDGEVWAICATGHRASLAASLLDRDGIPVRLVQSSGVDDFLRHCVG
jgi:glyoxylase-like metal-dependent hydrolase (beta-lactamase superfamily II)/rhodanese-related sulfurtransferase